jgi:hypothetical protein
VLDSMLGDQDRPAQERAPSGGSRTGSEADYADYVICII